MFFDFHRFSSHDIDFRRFSYDFRTIFVDFRLMYLIYINLNRFDLISMRFSTIPDDFRRFASTAFLFSHKCSSMFVDVRRLFLKLESMMLAPLFVIRSNGRSSHPAGCARSPAPNPLHFRFYFHPRAGGRRWCDLPTNVPAICRRLADDLPTICLRCADNSFSPPELPSYGRPRTTIDM